MSEAERDEIQTQISKQNWMQMIGTYGIPAVLLCAWYLQVYKPDQDLRRDMDRERIVADKAKVDILHNQQKALDMLIDQDRRRESQTAEMLRILQEQSATLKQIMIDQKRGAWNDSSNAKPNNGFVVKPGDAAGQN